MKVSLVRTVLRLVVVFACLSVLASCGGGGGGDGSSRSDTSLSLDKTSLSFSGDAPAQTVVATFRGDGVVVGTLPGQTLPLWLSVTAPGASASPATITVSTNAPVPPGRYTTTLRFATGRADGTSVVTQDVAVTYTVDHVLSTASFALTSYAGSSAPGPTASLTVSTNGASWEATSNQQWLSVTPASGTGTATLNVTTTPGSLAAGDHTGTITVRDTLTNRTRTSTINLVVRPRRLEVDQRGVALTSTIGTTHLTQAVQVIDTAGAGARWMASDDASWLSLSASAGTAGTPLTLTATDAGLAEGMHYATVTLSPDNEPGISNTATIRVGLYVDRTNPPPPEVLRATIVSSQDVVADPIRPYVYVSHLDMSGGSITAHNIYTGATVGTFASGDKKFLNMAISQDGSLLVVNNFTDGTLVPISLQEDTRVVGNAWGGMRLQNGTTNFVLARVSGTDVVLTGDRQILSASNGAVLAEFEGLDTLYSSLRNHITAAPDGSAVYLMPGSMGNHFVARLRLTNVNGTMRAIATHSFIESGDGKDFIVNPASTRLITFSIGANPPLRIYDATTMSLVTGRSVDVGAIGDLCTARNGDLYVNSSEASTITRFDSSFNPVGARLLSTTPGSRQFQHCNISGDGQRAIVREASTAGPGSYLTMFGAALPP
jgi:hypothetical protein